MKASISVFILIFFSVCVNAQSGYKDSMIAFQKNYVQTHEVVKDADTAYVSFYSVNDVYKLVATVERTKNMPWFPMPTSGNARPLYRVYATVHFTINGKEVKMNLYQSQSLMNVAEYKSHLFLPFTDATNGNATYDGGRYIDLSFDDIIDGKIVIDFNKAYNPYCAYVPGKYNCPIPPSENALPIKIEAGEKAFAKH